MIDSLGGATVVATLCEVSPQAVSQWRRDGIPAARRMFLKLHSPAAFADPETQEAELQRKFIDAVQDLQTIQLQLQRVRRVA